MMHFTLAKLTSCKMITTKSCTLCGCPILPIHCSNPLNSLVLIGWYAEKVFLSTKKYLLVHPNAQYDNGMTCRQQNPVINMQKD